MDGIKRIINNIFFKDRMKSFYKKYFYAKTHKGILKYIYYYQLTKLYRQYNCGIPLKADIKKSIVFPHGLNGIWISSGAKIGEDCVIFHQVTIGSNTLKDTKGRGSPTIGDNVYIGTGAKVIREGKNRKQRKNWSKLCSN